MLFRSDYTGYITFNDDVAGENIKFLLMVYQTMNDPRAIESIRRAMNIFAATQQRAPQAGWGLQHRVDNLRPVGARTYEPDGLTSHTTAGNISAMMNFYEWTGEERFLARLPEAFAWLDSIRLPDDQIQVQGRAYPDRKSTRLNSSHIQKSRMPSSA